MTTGSSIGAFASGAAVSLATSWVLVSRLERVGERLGLSQALLGMVTALAADAPEITTSVTAVAHHQRAVGAGVTIGSNVFNLAALLGLGAVVAGRIGLHRKVVILSGSVALAIAMVCLLAVAGIIAAGPALTLAMVVLVPYTVLLGADQFPIDRVRLPKRWAEWLAEAVVDEETELEKAIRPQRGGAIDAFLAFGALAVVVMASVAMEHGASALGVRYGIAQIVVGGLVLAAVTSLPNAVAAVYLARKGKGAAAFSTALNSNSINVIAGLLIPATVVGLNAPSASALLIVGWYLGLTAVMLLLAYAFRGLRRSTGWTIVALYALFVGALLVTA